MGARNGTLGRTPPSRKRNARFAIALVVALTAVTVAGGGWTADRAHAVEVPGSTIQLIMNGFETNGDMISTGNGLVGCGPTCAVHNGTGDNNGQNLAYVDIDGDPATFNSTAGRLTIPAGARVTRAWLISTGFGTNGSTCTGSSGPLKASIAQVKASQPVIKVDTGTYVNVGLADYTSSITLRSPATMATDVSAELASMTAGAHTITVGNVVSSQGFGCNAGWSLHVVYDYGQLIPGNLDSSKRKIYTSFGNVVVNIGVPLTVPFSGFTTSAPGANFIMSAIDGEPASGDTARITWTGGGQESLSSPLGSTTNVFRGNVTGAVSYANPPDASFYNGSVDTWRTRSSNLPVGSTSFNLALATTNDGYFVSAVSMSVPVPAVRIEKTPAANPAVDTQITGIGAAPQFQLRVSNESDAQLQNVRVTDPRAASCTRGGVPVAPAGGVFPLGTLNGGAVVILICAGATVPVGTSAGYTNTATVNADTITGETLQDADTSDVLVAALTTVKTVDLPIVPPGATVQWSITVRNTGQTSLRNVTLADPDCTGALTPPAGPGAGTGTLAVGDAWTYTCAEAVSADKTNTATATGTPFQTVGGVEITGGAVTASGDAFVDVFPAATRHISLEKTVDHPTVVAGETVTWSMAATNDGGTDIMDVVLTDDDCAGAIEGPTGPGTASGVLAQGAAWVYTCSEPISTPKTNLAQVSGTSFQTIAGQVIPGAIVRAQDDAQVSVLAPATPHLTLDKSGSPTVLLAGGTVIWTMAVTNDGETPLRNVALADPDCNGVVSGPTGTGALSGVLNIGAIWTYTCSEPATVTKTNTARVAADSFQVVDGREVGGPPVSATDSADVEVVQPGDPAVSLVKTVDDASVLAGDTVTWTIVVSNAGALPLRNIVVADSACTGSLTGPTNDVGDDSELALGEAWTYTCAEVVIASKVNIGSVIADSYQIVGGQPVPAAQVTAQDDADVAVTAQAPALTLDKSADITAFDNVGTVVTFAFILTNVGNVPLTDIHVTDPMPGLGDITCDAPLDTLAIGTSNTCHAAYAVTAADVAEGKIRNTATASGQSPLGALVTESDDVTIAAAVPAVPQPPLVVTGGTIPEALIAFGLASLALGTCLMVVRGRTPGRRP